MSLCKNLLIPRRQSESGFSEKIKQPQTTQNTSNASNTKIQDKIKGIKRTQTHSSTKIIPTLLDGIGWRSGVFAGTGVTGVQQWGKESTSFAPPTAAAFSDG